MRASTTAKPPTRPRVRISGELVRAHQVSVWRYLRFLGASPALADDLTQETFLTLLTRAPEDRGSTALAGWLRTSARRLFINQKVRGRFEITQDSVPEVEAVWEERVGSDGGADYIEAVRKCVARLPEADAQAIHLRFRDERDRKAIARALGISVEGVKTRLRRIKERLRLCVARRIRDDE